MNAYLWVALGSALGGMSRFWLSTVSASWGDGVFPWGTILINIVGSFIIGFFSTLTGPDGRLLIAPSHRAFVTVGICGGFTTFSSFSLQTLTLAQEGQWDRAGLNVALSVAAGHSAAAALNQLKGA